MNADIAQRPPAAAKPQKLPFDEARRWSASHDCPTEMMSRVDTVLLGFEPPGMGADTESALTLMVSVSGAAWPHHVYVFANCMKVLVQDGIGVRLPATQLHAGKFVWPKDVGTTLTLTRQQFDALVLGLSWLPRLLSSDAQPNRLSIRS